MIIDQLFENNKKPLNEVDPRNFDSDEDYYSAVKKQGQQQFSGDWDVQDEIASLENQARHAGSAALAHILFKQIDQLKRDNGIEDDEDEYEKEYDADIRARKGVAEAEGQLDELNFGKTKQFFNRVGQASRAFADNFKASGAAAPAPAGRTGSVSGSINPATNAPWTYDELIASRNARLSATQPAAEPEDSSTAGWDDPKSSKYVGRREVARRKAAQTVAPATTQPNYAGPRGYAKTTMNAPTGAQAFKQAVPAVPTALKTTVTPQLSKDEYIRRIGADAQPVAETVKQIKRMMETVATKADVQRVKDYIDYHLGTDLTEGAKLKRNRLLSEVTQLAAVRRREIARQTAK
jgi:hypothetical protein